MKSLNEFYKLVEEEKSDYSKFDVLVRAGLANKAQMQRIHRILDKMQEEKPVFNNADRMILQNLFNKMVDLISNNKQIFTQARKAVREEEEKPKGVIVSSDYKLSDTGRKVKAHRKVIENVELDEATPDLPDDPPYMLVLKRKQVRLFPNKMKVALYYNDKIDKYFSVSYGPGVDTSTLQAEEVEPIEEAVMDQLHKIVDGKQSQKVKFGDGSTRTVDHYTASAITQVHKHLNDENKKKLSDMVHKSPAHLAKAADFAFKRAK
jgi:hypothetical protein